MADKTKIEWCDSTVNPVMGCGGCELFPQPEQVLRAIGKVLSNVYPDVWWYGTAESRMRGLLSAAWRNLQRVADAPGVGHHEELTTTNIWHLRQQFPDSVRATFGRRMAAVVEEAIARQVTCYAAILHLNKGYSVTKPGRTPHSGYAPSFEQVTRFPGRMADMARKRDLTGAARTEKPWMNGLPRLVFLSDMGDALSREEDFNFLQSECAAFTSHESS